MPEHPTLGQAIRFIAGMDDDRAEELNGVGFNKFDGEFGHSLASQPEESWSPKQRRAAWKLMKKYRRQLLEHADIDFSDFPEPPDPDSAWGGLV